MKDEPWDAAIIGGGIAGLSATNNNEAAAYALGMLLYSPCVIVATISESSNS